MGMMVTKQIVRDCELFSTLNNVELEKIVGSFEEKQYEAGSIIFNEGDKAEELLMLEEGRVAVQMTMPGTQEEMSRRMTVDVISRNEVIGWSTVVEPFVYNFTAVCLQKVKALSISGSKLRGLLRDNPRIGYEVLKGLIKVVALRLDDTRWVLASERLLSPRHNQ